MHKSILVISDLHIPYHHRDSFAFLKEIKKEFKPDFIVNIRDLLDFHAINMHTHDIFPSHVLKMIQVGEDAGAMDDMLGEIGDMTDAEVQDRVLKLTATIEPMITVVMGVFILILALAIFLPIWDMYEALSTG